MSKKGAPTWASLSWSRCRTRPPAPEECLMEEVRLDTERWSRTERPNSARSDSPSTPWRPLWPDRCKRLGAGTPACQTAQEVP
jgi:hypothetical protein